MMSTIRLDDMVDDMCAPLRAAAVECARRLVSRALRTVATGLVFLADVFEPEKKKKRA
jgi:hypothetical protein